MSVGETGKSITY